MAGSLRSQILAFAEQNLGCKTDSPWVKTPNYVVMRHALSKKWAGIIMDIPACYIGVGEDEIIDVMNVKLDPLLIASLRNEEGYAPAWHMSKEHWLTVRLDGTVPVEQACALLEMSNALVG